MKKSIYLLPALALTLALSGCNQDNLNIDQKGVTSFDDYYKTDEEAIAAVTKMYVDSQKNFTLADGDYNTRPYDCLVNWQSPDMWFSGESEGDCLPGRDYHSFNYGYEHDEVIHSYTMLYRSIHKANIVINYFTEERLGSLSPTMKRAVAEARVMRAFDHFTLAQYWGTPPIVDNVLSAESRPANAASRDAVFEFCLQDIEAALNDLDERASVDDRDGSYKITKGFALALKGKILLWKKDYAGAKAALKQVITSGKYALLPGEEMTKIGHADGQGSCESIFEFNFVDVPEITNNDVAQRSGWNFHKLYSWRWDQFNIGNKGLVHTTGWGWLAPTKDFCEALISNDGFNSNRRKAWFVTYDEITTDPVWVEKLWKSPSKVGLKKDKQLFINAGYLPYKMVVHPDQGDLAAESDNPAIGLSIMRYAEVLLLYAEACAMTQDNDGLQYLNEIQRRAGSQTISSSLTLDAVKKERRFELWWESGYSADLIRWGDTEPLKNVDNYCPSFGYKDGKFVGVIEDNADLFVKKFGSKMGFHEGRDELLPFPKEALELNSALVQNPGW